MHARRSSERPGSLTAVVSLLTASLAAAAPVVRDLEVTTLEDNEVQGQVAANNGEALASKLKRWPRHGDVKLEGGAFTYRPAKDFNGDDTFWVDVSAGRRTATARVTVHVEAVND